MNMATEFQIDTNIVIFSVFSTTAAGAMYMHICRGTLFFSVHSQSIWRWQMYSFSLYQYIRSQSGSRTTVNPFLKSQSCKDHLNLSSPIPVKLQSPQVNCWLPPSAIAHFLHILIQFSLVNKKIFYSSFSYSHDF